MINKIPLTVIVALIFALTFFTYYPSLFYDFVYLDDYEYVMLDAHLHQFSLENFYHILTSLDSAYWAPVTRFSYMLDYAIWGENRLGYHLSNNLLHAANAVWLWLLVYVLLRLPQLNYQRYFSVFAATLGALIFALHPQNVEPVAWVASRKDVLSLFFLLPTILCYLAYIQTSHKTAWYLASIACFVLAIGSKPIVMSLPFILLLLDAYPLKRMATGLAYSATEPRPAFSYLLIEKIPFFLLALIPASLATLAHAQNHILADLTQLSLTTRILNAADMVLLYLSHSLIPLALSPLYLFPEPAQLSWLPVIGLALISILLLIYYRRYPVGLIAWLFFLATLFPTLGIVSFNKLQAGADRFTYLPAIIIYILLGFALAKLFYAQVKFKIITVIFSIFILSALFGLTRQQQSIWQNDLSFRQYILLHNQDSYLAHFGMATVYERHQAYLKAIEHYQKSLSIEPKCLKCYNSLGSVYLRLNNKAAALATFNALLQQAKPCQAELEMVYFNVGLIYFEQGHYQQAEQLASNAIQCNPQYEPAKALQQQARQSLTP